MPAGHKRVFAKGEPSASDRQRIILAFGHSPELQDREDMAHKQVFVPGGGLASDRAVIFRRRFRSFMCAHAKPWSSLMLSPLACRSATGQCDGIGQSRSDLRAFAG